MHKVLIISILLLVSRYKFEGSMIFKKSVEPLQFEAQIDNARKIEMEFLEKEKKFDPDVVYKGQPNPTKI